MNIFKKGFYPTPKELIDKMLNGIDFRYVNRVLEPSAGTGNLADEVWKRMWSLRNNKYYGSFRDDFNNYVDCVEIEPDFRQFLTGKGHNVVADDFLAYEPDIFYDLIVMNPPFEAGAKHLLHALDIQERNGGYVVALLNASTLENLCNNERLVLKSRLLEYGADISFIDNSFVSADRPTGVRVALIKVKLPDVKKESFFWNNLSIKEFYKEDDFRESGYSLAENDMFKTIISQYKKEVEAGINLINEFNSLKVNILRDFSDCKGSSILTLKLSGADKYGDDVSINEYVKAVRKKYWSALFKNDVFTGQLTSNLLNNYQNEVNRLINYDFSMFNIIEIKKDMMKKMSLGVEEQILNLFEEFSYKHYYDVGCSNIHYYNGWKTNKSYIVNSKVILPLNAFGNYDGCFQTYKVSQKISDIHKCFEYLDTGVSTLCDVIGILRDAKHNDQTRNIVFKYFEVTFYKKGTCHIKFTNMDILKKFNIFGSQKRGWLPPAYGKCQYKDFSEEEKRVVDDFDTVLNASYDDILSNRDYFLVQDSMQLLDKAV